MEVETEYTVKGEQCEMHEGDIVQLTIKVQLRMVRENDSVPSYRSYEVEFERTQEEGHDLQWLYIEAQKGNSGPFSPIHCGVVQEAAHYVQEHYGLSVNTKQIVSIA